MSRVRPVHHHSHAVGGLCVAVASVAHAIFSICAQARQFETTFVDPYTKGRCTVTFWVGEPVLYHPPHLATPVFTHIDLISDSFFAVANSTIHTRTCVNLHTRHNQTDWYLSIIMHVKYTFSMCHTIFHCH